MVCYWSRNSSYTQCSVVGLVAGVVGVVRVAGVVGILANRGTGDLLNLVLDNRGTGGLLGLVLGTRVILGKV